MVDISSNPILEEAIAFNDLSDMPGGNIEVGTVESQYLAASGLTPGRVLLAASVVDPNTGGLLTEVYDHSGMTYNAGPGSNDLTVVDSIIGGTLTDGTAILTGGALTGVTEVGINVASVSGHLHVKSPADGTATEVYFDRFTNDSNGDGNELSFIMADAGTPKWYFGMNDATGDYHNSFSIGNGATAGDKFIRFSQENSPVAEVIELLRPIIVPLNIQTDAGANTNVLNFYENATAVFGLRSDFDGSGVDNLIKWHSFIYNKDLWSIDGDGNVRTPQDNAKRYFGAGDDYSIEWDGSDAVHTITSGDFVFTGGSLGVSTSAPICSSGGADISNGAIGLIVGADPNVTTRTNETQKYGRMGIPHYLNAEQPMAVFLSGSNATTNGVYIGGGSSYFNAATLLAFYCAEDTTTTTGTRRARMLYDEFRLYSGVDMYLDGDGSKLYFGAGDDASLTWDSAKFIIDAGAADLAQLAYQPTGGTDLAIATTKYVDDNAGGISNLDGGASDTVYAGVTDSPVDGGDATT